MLDVAKFKQHLLDSGLVEQAHIERAQKHAFEKGLSLSDALLALNIIGVRKLGQCLSDVYELPYAAIQNRAVSAEARRMVPAECVRRWKTVPVALDQEANILTLAIFDPDHALKIEKIFHFLMYPVTLGFVIVSRSEMQSVLSTHDRAGSDKAQTSSGAPSSGPEKKKLTLSGLHRPTPPAKTGSGPGADATSPTATKRSLFSGATPPKNRAGAPAQKRPAAESPKDPARADAAISQSLLNSVALLVQSRLHDTPDKIMLAKARVRYCKLLAARTNGTPESVDAVTLAAWVSVLDDPLETARQLLSPYDLEGILSGKSTPADDTMPEAAILTMVQQYQALKGKDPAAAHDLHKVREALRSSHAPSAEQDARLEAFLQILMDEEFILSQEKALGHILIVDPAAKASASRPTPLADDESDAIASSDSSTTNKPSEVNKPDTMSASADQGVRGSLEDMSFTDMVQILCAGGRSLEIILKSPAGEGCVHVAEGNIVHAEADGKTGEQAFHTMMQWHEGVFSTQSKSDFPTRSIQTSLMSLLMEGARFSDEA